jgi:hypothetical protein
MDSVIKIALGCLLLSLGAMAQESTRQLWNTEFLNERPPAKNAAPAAPRPRSGGFIVGVTIWQLRPASNSDPPETRLLVLEGGKQDESAPQRIEAGTPLKPGDRVRLTIEAPRPGYLYVVDQEQYSGGKFGEPYLIYPNWQTKPGDNATAPGRLIEIPDQRNEPNCFTIRPSRPDQSGELLTLLITAQPLTGLAIGREPLRLQGEQFAEWERKYGASAQRLELAGGAGKQWTPQEKKAGADRSVRLTQDDPVPQTFYRVTDRTDPPVLLHMPLRIAPSSQIGR